MYTTAALNLVLNSVLYKNIFELFDFWILDFGFLILDFEIRILDFGFWILDFGSWILDFGFQAVILDFGFWILYFATNCQALVVYT